MLDPCSNAGVEAGTHGIGMKIKLKTGGGVTDASSGQHASTVADSGNGASQSTVNRLQRDVVTKAQQLVRTDGG